MCYLIGRARPKGEVIPRKEAREINDETKDAGLTAAVLSGAGIQ